MSDLPRESLPLVVFLMGPTASGKTSLAIELCEHLPCEVISVDSALIYRDMNIGSAKPSLKELEKTPHRLVDICDPVESYSAAKFRLDALQAIEDIIAAGKIPLLVGGTMLYFKALLEGLASMPATDLSIRAKIEADAQCNGWPYVHAQLAQVDPESAARIHPNHSQRIERALGVYLSSGVTMTEHFLRQQQQGPEVLPFNIVQLAIAPLDRTVLHQRVEKRFSQMMEQGFVDEVRALRERKDLHVNLPSMKAVGYRQVWQYLDGELDYTQMLERGVIATRQLAKRQFTWLKAWKNVNWIHTDSRGLLCSSEQTQAVVHGLEGQVPLNLALKYLNRVST